MSKTKATTNQPTEPEIGLILTLALSQKIVDEGTDNLAAEDIEYLDAALELPEDDIHHRSLKLALDTVKLFEDVAELWEAA